MHRSLALLPLLALAGTSLSGCVAVAIPALAGAGMVGSSVADNGGDEEGAAVPAPPVAAQPEPAAPVAQPAPAPRVAVAAAPTVEPNPAPVPEAEPTPALKATPVPELEPVRVVAAPPPAPTPDAAPAMVPAPASTPTPTPTPTPAPPPGPAAAAPVPGPLKAYPDPALPLAPEQASFARFVRYGQVSARQAASGAELPSAMLADAVALDGKRRRCTAGEQLVAVIDLDPSGGVFAPPATPPQQPALALGLALLREAGVEIAWLSDLSTTQSGGLRTALEQSGLDPRGQDIIALRRDEADTKDQRKASLGAITCIIAIAGDERPDFDARFKYLRNPEAGAGIEPLIGDGWFLIAPLLGN